ncbi:MAG: hypothetical protein WB919_23865 [Candidatus Sulfotelmatobacter sp.]
MKIKLDRIISIATLVVLVVITILLLRKPAPVVQERPSAGTGSNAQSRNPQTFNQKADQSDLAGQQVQPSQSSGGYSAVSSAAPSAVPQPAQNSATAQSAKADSRASSSSNSDAISAAINQMLGASGGGGTALSPDSNVGSGSPNIKDQKVTYDGDTVHGQFLTEIGGKDVWVTISGHMGQKDGYATFDPTEFKVGDVEVPVALVNPALQRKLAEERDRLKVAGPDAQ